MGAAGSWGFPCNEKLLAAGKATASGIDDGGASIKAKPELNGFVYFAVGVATLGGLLFGYDTGVISGAILVIKNQPSLSATMEEIVVSSVLYGVIAAAAWIFFYLLVSETKGKSSEQVEAH